MPYKQFVEVGRLALVNFGEHSGKLAVIVDILDDKRVLIDLVDGARQMIPIKRLQLTDFVAQFPRAAAPADVAAAVKSADLVKKFNETKWAQRIARREAKAQMNDFQRFKYEQLVAKRNELIAKELAKN